MALDVKQVFICCLIAVAVVQFYNNNHINNNKKNKQNNKHDKNLNEMSHDKSVHQYMIGRSEDDPRIDNRELYDACDYMWDLDDNRLEFDKDIKVNLSGLKRSIHDKVDRCDDPFFSYVDNSAFERPTFKTFIALLDNYKCETGVAEEVTQEEKDEEIAFIKAVFKTRPMQFCVEFLRKHNKLPDDDLKCMKMIHAMWFGLYRRERGGPLDSSGFEHVFVGEIKNGEVSGLHNWIQLYREEQKGTLDYKGFFMGRSRSGRQVREDRPYVVSLQFSWNGVDKKVGSTLVGVSPEFELALYTMCFLCGDGKDLVELGDFQTEIVCHDYNRGRNIGSCYPQLPR